MLLRIKKTTWSKSCRLATTWKNNHHMVINTFDVCKNHIQKNNILHPEELTESSNLYLNLSLIVQLEANHTFGRVRKSTQFDGFYMSHVYIYSGNTILHHQQTGNPRNRWIQWKTLLFLFVSKVATELHAVSVPFSNILRILSEISRCNNVYFKYIMRFRI